MKAKIFILTLLLLFSASAAMSQVWADPDDFSGPPSTPIAKTNAPGGDGFLPSLLHSQAENGRIKIDVGVDQPFANFIADVIEFDIDITTDKDVKIDPSSLKQGIIEFGGSDYVYALDDPHTFIRLDDGTNVHYHIVARVQTFVDKPLVPFKLTLRYVCDPKDDGKAPDWKVLETPAYNITFADVYGESSDLLQGPLDFTTSPDPYLFWPAAVLGTLMFGLLPGVVLVRWLNRIRPKRVKTRAEIAWAALKPVFKAGRKYGFTNKSFEQIVEAVRFYFDIATLPFAKIEEQFSGDLNLPLLSKVLQTYEGVLFRGEKISPEENEELLRAIAKLIPRPAGLL
jgi:hypothetical protein